MVAFVILSVHPATVTAGSLKCPVVAISYIGRISTISTNLDVILGVSLVKRYGTPVGFVIIRPNVRTILRGSNSDTESPGSTVPVRIIGVYLELRGHAAIVHNKPVAC